MSGVGRAGVGTWCLGESEAIDQGAGWWCSSLWWWWRGRLVVGLGGGRRSPAKVSAEAVVVRVAVVFADGRNENHDRSVACKIHATAVTSTKLHNRVYSSKRCRRSWLFSAIAVTAKSSEFI